MLQGRRPALELAIRVELLMVLLKASEAFLARELGVARGVPMKLIRGRGSRLSIRHVEAIWPDRRDDVLDRIGGL